MLQSYRTYLMIVGLAVAAVVIELGTATPAIAQDGSSLEKIAANWTSRNSQFKSARYRVTSKVLVKRGQKTDVDDTTGAVYPEQDYVYDREAMLLVDFVTAKMRWEINDHVWNVSLKKFHPQYRISILDGTQLSIYRPPAENTSAVYKPSAIQPELSMKSAIKDFNTAVPFSYRPILFGHGFVLPAQATPSSEPALLPAATAVSFMKSVDVLNLGPKQLISAKMQLPGARIGGDEVRLEVGRGFPVVGWTIYFNNQPWMVFDITYEDTPHGSFPKQWTLSRMQNGMVENSTTYEVVSREFDVSVAASEFEVSPRPSAVVIKDGQFYRADQQGKSLARTTPAALTRELESPKRTYPILAIALLLIVFTCVLVVRHWRKRLATH